MFVVSAVHTIVFFLHCFYARPPLHPRVPLYRMRRPIEALKERGFTRQALEWKYASTTPQSFKDAPEPLTNYLDVSERELVPLPKLIWLLPGFHTDGGGGGGGPGIPPPEILKLGMVIIVVPSILAICMLLDISMCHQNVVWKVCPRLRQKQSERI